MENLPSLLENAIDSSDVVWREIEHCPVTEEIPLVKQFVKIWRGVNDIRTRILAAKLRGFVCDPSLQSPEMREKMRERVESDEGKKIGQTLFMVLERLTDLNKPLWLAKLFAGYLLGELTASELRRLASAVDLAFGDDLIALLVAREPVLSSQPEPWKQYLAQSGLTELSQVTAIGGQRYHEVTSLGMLLRKVVRTHSGGDAR